MIEIRIARDEHSDGIWAIFHEVIGAGTTYIFEPDLLAEAGLIDAYLMHRFL